MNPGTSLNIHLAAGVAGPARRAAFAPPGQEYRQRSGPECDSVGSDRHPAAEGLRDPLGPASDDNSHSRRTEGQPLSPACRHPPRVPCLWSAAFPHRLQPHDPLTRPLTAPAGTGRFKPGVEVSQPRCILVGSCKHHRSVMRYRSGRGGDHVAGADPLRGLAGRVRRLRRWRLGAGPPVTLALASGRGHGEYGYQSDARDHSRIRVRACSRTYERMYQGPPLPAPEVPEPFQPPNGWMSGHAPVVDPARRLA